jgi:hypothetical protein
MFEVVFEGFQAQQKAPVLAEERCKQPGSKGNNEPGKNVSQDG